MFFDWEFAEHGFDLFEPIGCYFDGNEIGLGKVSVVVCFFLFSLQNGYLIDVVPASCGFVAHLQGLACFEEVVELSLGFVGYASFESAETVEIFYFGDRCFVFFAVFCYGQVDVWFETHVAFLHVGF